MDEDDQFPMSKTEWADLLRLIGYAKRTELVADEALPGRLAEATNMLVLGLRPPVPCTVTTAVDTHHRRGQLTHVVLSDDGLQVVYRHTNGADNTFHQFIKITDVTHVEQALR